MIYAMSDIHGQYELFRNLMEQIPLGKDDTLYVLGDVVDRGPDSMKILKYMMANPNIIPIMATMSSCSSVSETSGTGTFEWLSS